MTEENKNIPLVGYANRLSVRPKETISFKVSSELKSNYLVDLYRSISADPNPEAMPRARTPTAVAAVGPPEAKKDECGGRRLHHRNPQHKLWT